MGALVYPAEASAFINNISDKASVVPNWPGRTRIPPEPRGHSAVCGWPGTLDVTPVFTGLIWFADHR